VYNGAVEVNEQSKTRPEARGKVIGTVEIKKIGNSSGIILPKDVLARMHVSVGDRLYATLTPDGGFRLTPYDPDFEKAMEVARRGIKRYHNALAELAK
jgi:putative addiction module antidote